MSDPVTTSIELALTAVKTGAAVAQWWQTRQTRQTNVSQSESSGSSFYRQQPEDLLYVLATMGQWLFSLDVVNISALTPARMATRLAFRAGDPEDDDLGDLFDTMGELVQNAVTSGMVFCAECWPMHMWKGFGCGVFNELQWADPNHSNIHCLELDNSIAALKSQPHQWQLLRKSPTQISKTDPQTVPFEKAVSRKIASLSKDVYQQFEKDGFPQPLAPFDHIGITYWWVPFATWNGNSMYEDDGHSAEAIAKYQLDPGRFLWAWTAGKHATIRLGEAVLLPQSHIAALAQWLEGLKGVPFRVLMDHQFNYGKIRFSRSTRNVLKKHFGNEFGVSGEAFVLVHDPKMQVIQHNHEQLSGQFNNLHISPSPTMEYPQPQGESPGYSAIPQSPVSGNISFPDRPSLKRRPVPRPPPSSMRTVIATHDGIPESDTELAFNRNDIIEVLDDTAEDGWWKARLNGKIGLIPNTFVRDINAMDKQPPVQCLDLPSPPLSPESSIRSVSTTVRQAEPQVSLKTDFATYDDQYLHRSFQISEHDMQSSQSSEIPGSNTATQQTSFSPSITGGGYQEHSYPPEFQEQQSFEGELSYRAALSPTQAPIKSEQQPVAFSWPDATQTQDNMLSSSQVPLQAQGGQGNFTVEQRQWAASTPAIRPEESSVASTSAWNLDGAAARPPTALYTLHGHVKAVNGVAFASCGSLLASGSNDKTVKLWDITSGRVQQTLTGHTSGVQGLSFSPDGMVLASASEDETVRLWDVRTNGAALQSLNQSSWVENVAISPDGKMLAAALLNNTIQLWDSRSLAVLYTLKGHKSIVQSVAFSPDSNILASGSNDKHIMTWNPNSGQERQRIKAHPGMMNYVKAVAFSPDGKLLASASLDGTVKIWVASSGAALRTLKHSCAVCSVAFSSDGKTLVTGTASGVVTVWSCSGKEQHSWTAHKKSIEEVAVSPNGRLLAAASEDKTVSMWNMG